MCGIAGILKVHPPGAAPPPPEVAIPEAWLDILDESIKHRGPDGHGRFRDRATRPDGSVVDVAFVHRRLAIIDLADGHQPMVSERGPGYPERERSHRVAVVFNGCIYNHRELRRELQRAGHKFTTDHSDTEVLIHGWREWGHGLFDKIDGMAALAIWDAKSGLVVTIRDPVGEKPLYQCFAEHFHVFASSAAGVERIRGRTRLDGESQGEAASSAGVAAWLRFGWNYQLPLRRIVQHEHHETRPEMRDHAAYARWISKAAKAEVGERRSRRISPEQTDVLLRRAVESRLESDVPLGVFLSGGIDSSLVAHYARASIRDVTAFTVRMPSPEHDESAAAATTAQVLGIRHEILDCDSDPASDLPWLIQNLGLPFGDSSLLPTYWLCKAARQSVKVALSGDGGDELFLGYERQCALHALWAASHVAPLNRLLLRALGGRAASIPAISRLSRFLEAASGAGYEDLLSIFPASQFDRLTSQSNPPNGLNDTTRSPGAVQTLAKKDYITAALRVDFVSYLPQDLLRKTDTASMSVALEVRAPFLARELVDRMIRVRPDVLMPDGERKGLLKQVARKYLPDEIVNRPKMGFSIPIGEWFRTDYGGMKQLLLDTLNSADPFPESLLGIKINRPFVAKMVADHMDRRRDHSQRLYMLLVLSIWAKQVLRTTHTSALGAI